MGRAGPHKKGQNEHDACKRQKKIKEDEERITSFRNNYPLSPLQLSRAAFSSSPWRFRPRSFLHSLASAMAAFSDPPSSPSKDRSFPSIAAPSPHSVKEIPLVVPLPLMRGKRH